jgi:uncharacterized protein (DUF488 family)
VLFTIGHSNRALHQFIALLKEHGIERLLDIRTIPRSRHNPQFEGDALGEALAAAGIAYEHWPQLGGLRRPRRDSENTGWRNTSFRGYADYMQTPEFAAAIDALAARAARERLALMCAEAVPWRCHRSLVADAFAARAIEVQHVIGPGAARRHSLTPFAKVEGVRVTYPDQNHDPDQARV